MLNPVAMEVYAQTIKRLEACANELADCTHMVASAQINLTVDEFEGQDHLSLSVEALQVALKRFKKQLANIESEQENELEYAD